VHRVWGKVGGTSRPSVEGGTPASYVRSETGNMPRSERGELIEKETDEIWQLREQGTVTKAGGRSSARGWGELDKPLTAGKTEGAPLQKKNIPTAGRSRGGAGSSILLLKKNRRSKFWRLDSTYERLEKYIIRHPVGERACSLFARVESQITERPS